MCFKNVAKSIISNNRFHSFYPGMLSLEDNCSENMISSNHFLRDNEPWKPMLDNDNGLDDSYGLLYINGNNNSIVANHISEMIQRRYIKPLDAMPVIIRIASGRGNYISNNHIVATCDIENELQDASDSCYSAQVDALTSLNNIREMSVVYVLVEQEATNNTILDSGNEKQVILDRTVNVFRPTPALGD